jgi:hypothetical protein
LELNTWQTPANPSMETSRAGRTSCATKIGATTSKIKAGDFTNVGNRINPPDRASTPGVSRTGIARAVMYSQRVDLPISRLYRQRFSEGTGLARAGSPTV